MSTPQRYAADCRNTPSDNGCSLFISGSEEEVLSVLEEHVITAHRHRRSPELVAELREGLRLEGPVGHAGRNRALATSVYEAFNRRDFGFLERLAAVDAVSTDVATGEIFRGPKGFRTAFENWARAFPDSHVEIDRLVATDDGYVVEFTGTGTQKGPIVTPTGTIPPTGRRATLRFVDTVIVRDGRISEARAYYDSLGMLTQLGVAPSPPPPQPEQPQSAAPRH